MALVEDINMADRSYDKQPERLMNDLADSVPELSDEELFLELGETGDDRQKEAGSTRAVLKDACDIYEQVNWRLSNSGHTVDPRAWSLEKWAYHNHCRICGLQVNFTASTGEIWGNALIRGCSDAQREKWHQAVG
jgi:hypothetical protein